MSFTSMAQVCAEIDRRAEATTELHIECGRLEQENAELRDALGRREDRWP